MKVTLLTVGRTKGVMADPIREYEQRIRHYFSFGVVEVKEESAAHGRSAEQVMEAEGDRLLARVPSGAEVVALDPAGTAWSSGKLAEHLHGLALSAHPGMALVSLSAMTLPHELARLVITEQLYRAGTILRGEPYHK